MKTKTTRYQDTSTKTAKITQQCQQQCWVLAKTQNIQSSLMHQGAAAVENGSESHTVK